MCLVASDCALQRCPGAQQMKVARLHYVMRHHNLDDSIEDAKGGWKSHFSKERANCFVPLCPSRHLAPPSSLFSTRLRSFCFLVHVPIDPNLPCHDMVWYGAPIFIISSNPSTLRRALHCIALHGNTCAVMSCALMASPFRSMPRRSKP